MKVKKSKSKLNSKVNPKVLIPIIGVAVLAVAGLGWWYVARNDQAGYEITTQSPDSSTDQQQSENSSIDSATPPTGSGSSSNGNASSNPAPQPSQPAANITNPTAANCPASGQKITVYASKQGGTPAYLDHPVYRDSSNKVVKTYEYGSQINNAICDEAQTALFVEVAHNNYYRFNFSDVSITKP